MSKWFGRWTDQESSFDKREPPTCRRCNYQTIWADAGVVKHIPYFYCRTCKVEVNDEGFRVCPVVAPPPSEDRDDGDEMPELTPGGFFISQH